MLKYRLNAYFSRRRGMLALCWLALLAIIVLSAIFAVNKMLDSVLEDYVGITLEGIISSAVNSAVLEELQSGKNYSDLVRVMRDGDGKVSSVDTDALRVNLLKSQIALRVLEALERPENREISVPIGTLLGSKLMLGRGPAVRVRLVTVGTANTAVASEFCSAGINQTLHRMVLEVEIGVTVIMPGSVTLRKYENLAVLSETVIVGDVPESYTYIDDTRDDSLDKILDHSGT